MSDERPIGVFDSGVGGITVLRAVMNLLPNERLIYFGDTGRVPYGSKSPETVVEYAVQIAGFLKEMKAKSLVVACNTACATAGKVLEDLMQDVPIIGVIKPASRNAVAATKNGRIGVIGTKNTIASGAYEREIAALNPSLNVYAVACPMFVPFIEENQTNSPAFELEVKTNLAPLIDKGIDTMILGCTHYPLVRDTIQKIIGHDVTLIDSGASTADELLGVLQNRGIASTEGNKDLSFYITGGVDKFAAQIQRFGLPTMHIKRVDVVDLKQPIFVQEAKPYAIKPASA